MFTFLIFEELLSDSNSILRSAYKSGSLRYEASGSSSQRINGSIQKTKPEYVFDQVNKKYDWCSNCPSSYDEHPYIVFSVANKIMKLRGYFLRAGCCAGYVSECCCIEQAWYCCRCCLYSWSFQISHDNITWKTVHKVERDRMMEYCAEKTYQFSETYDAKYARIIQDENCPGEPPCIALNKIELIGTIDGDLLSENDLNLDSEEEDVSIIGHISKNDRPAI